MAAPQLMVLNSSQEEEQKEGVLERVYLVEKLLCHGDVPGPMCNPKFKYTKFNSNFTDIQNAPMPDVKSTEGLLAAALSHYSYVSTEGKVLLIDLQGSIYKRKCNTISQSLSTDNPDNPDNPDNSELLHLFIFIHPK